MTGLQGALFLAATVLAASFAFLMCKLVDACLLLARIRRELARIRDSKPAADADDWNPGRRP